MEKVQKVFKQWKSHMVRIRVEAEARVWKNRRENTLQ